MDVKKIVNFLLAEKITQAGRKILRVTMGEG
jgi:hypothetical protein